MRCQGCGAAVRYSAEVQGLRCAFCGEVMRIEEVVDPPEHTAAFLPFTVEGERARAALRSWLGSRGWFRPPDLRKRAELASLRPLWWVGWVFDARAKVSWTCDSDAGANRADWAPHSGQFILSCEEVAISASRGLTTEEAETLFPSYDLRTAGEAPGAVEGALGPPIVEEFDVQRSQARRRLLAAIDRVAESRVREYAPGSRLRNVHVVCLLHGFESRGLAFPAWVLAYRYREQLYRVVISGQGETTILGKAPWSLPRILLAIFFGIVALLLLLGLGGLVTGAFVF